MDLLVDFLKLYIFIQKKLFRNHKIPQLHPLIKAIHGPRMPWQDIHARVEGRAARDIMINFVERSVTISLISMYNCT